jgi:hypothetical protein
MFKFTEQIQYSSSDDDDSRLPDSCINAQFNFQQQSRIDIENISNISIVVPSNNMDIHNGVSPINEENLQPTYASPIVLTNDTTFSRRITTPYPTLPNYSPNDERPSYSPYPMENDKNPNYSPSPIDNNLYEDEEEEYNTMPYSEDDDDIEIISRTNSIVTDDDDIVLRANSSDSDATIIRTNSSIENPPLQCVVSNTNDIQCPMDNTSNTRGLFSNESDQRDFSPSPRSVLSPMETMNELDELLNNEIQSNRIAEIENETVSFPSSSQTTQNETKKKALVNTLNAIRMTTITKTKKPNKQRNNSNTTEKNFFKSLLQKPKKKTIIKDNKDKVPYTPNDNHKAIPALELNERIKLFRSIIKHILAKSNSLISKLNKSLFTTFMQHDIYNTQYDDYTKGCKTCKTTDCYFIVMNKIHNYLIRDGPFDDHNIYMPHEIVLKYMLLSLGKDSQLLTAEQLAEDQSICVENILYAMVHYINDNIYNYKVGIYYTDMYPTMPTYIYDTRYPTDDITFETIILNIVNNKGSIKFEPYTKQCALSNFDFQKLNNNKHINSNLGFDLAIDQSAVSYVLDEIQSNGFIWLPRNKSQPGLLKCTTTLVHHYGLYSKILKILLDENQMDENIIDSKYTSIKTKLQSIVYILENMFLENKTFVENNNRAGQSSDIINEIKVQQNLSVLYEGVEKPNEQYIINDTCAFLGNTELGHDGYIYNNQIIPEIPKADVLYRVYGKAEMYDKLIQLAKVTPYKPIPLDIGIVSINDIFDQNKPLLIDGTMLSYNKNLSNTYTEKEPQSIENTYTEKMSQFMAMARKTIHTENNGKCYSKAKFPFINLYAYDAMSHLFMNKCFMIQMYVKLLMDVFMRYNNGVSKVTIIDLDKTDKLEDKIDDENILLINKGNHWGLLYIRTIHADIENKITKVKVYDYNTPEYNTVSEMITTFLYKEEERCEIDRDIIPSTNTGGSWIEIISILRRFIPRIGEDTQDDYLKTVLERPIINRSELLIKAHMLKEFECQYILSSPSENLICDPRF